MKILIIGGTRFFGIHTVRALLENGHDVTVASRGNRENPFSEQTEQIIMDKTDAASVQNALAGRYFDLIIDKVAYASNDVRTLLMHANCERYLQMSSSAVYSHAHLQIQEHEFDAAQHTLVWMDRPEDYAEGKRQAEHAALEFLAPERCTFVRYPVVLGENDYTGRLRFYAEHIRSGKPMRILHPDVSVSYIHETEAGQFIAYLAEHPVSGAVNGCSSGMLSQREIIASIEQMTGEKAVLSADGDPAPYDNNPADTSLDCARAEATGFRFTAVSLWINDLLRFECEH